MPRRQEPFSVVRRPGSPYWYYKLGPWKSYKSSGKTTKADAITVALEALESPAEAPGGPTLRKYVEPFFVWETCPHVKRLVAEGKSITRYHVRDMRSIMENHLLTDPVVTVRLSALKRSHILDYRERLIEKLGYTRTVQKAVGVLKTILKEAYFREDITRDPTVGIGTTRYQPKEIGVFTAEELKKLFPTEPPGPWGDLAGYTVFLMAATTGMRRGEILALTWERVNIQEKCIKIRQAWKDRHEMGPPKWGKTRVTPMPGQLSKALERYRTQSSHAEEEDLVFCHGDGARFGNTWWAKRFTAAMKKTKIDREKRNIRPHSFRHTLNSILLEQGYDPARIRIALGWSSEDVQEKYTHWLPDTTAGQREIIDKLFNDKKGS